MKSHSALEDVTPPHEEEEEGVFGRCIKKHPAVHRMCPHIIIKSI